jgi:hypothetical protein
MIDPPADKNPFEKARNDALALVERAIDFLRTKRKERLASAEIDLARLRALAEAASSAGFSKATGDFPIPLFETVDFVEKVLKPFTLRLNSVERAIYTTPRMADPVINETDWWRETMKERAAFIVLNDVIWAAPTDEVAATSPQDYWHKLRDRAAAITEGGGRPILLVESEFHPRWLYDWRAGRLDSKSPERPSDLQISRQDADRDQSAYLFHMNNLAVYRAPVGERVSYLIPRALFRTLHFTHYDDGLPVDVRWVDDASDSEHGTITATFAREVTMGEGSVLKLRYR